MTQTSEVKPTKKAAGEPGDGALTKALAILDRIAEAGKPMRFVALLAENPYPKATLHRLLRMLTRERMLSFDPVSQTYSVGPRVIRLAYASWNSSGLAEAARQVLDRLAERVDETLRLSQLDGGQVLYLDKRAGQQAAFANLAPGKVEPAYCTAAGKAMLAFLDGESRSGMLVRQAFHRYTPNTPISAEELEDQLAEVRRQGFALDHEEYEYGIISAAVPVHLADGTLYGALSLTGSLHRTSMEELTAFVEELKVAAFEIADQARIHMTPAL
ncbi:MAG: IclR family transcriptional regulator [Rhodospirillales bacterium]|nr:IclR family transcriptional regulator [Rhodospirillales bacterium]